MDSNGDLYGCMYPSCSLTSESPANIDRHTLTSLCKKKQCVGTGEKPTQQGKSDYRSQMSVLEGLRSDVCC